jgi:hypothetical protein
VTTHAIGLVNLPAVLGVATLRVGAGRRGQRLEIGEDLPRLVLEEPRLRRHLGASNAVLDRREQAVVGSA